MADVLTIDDLKEVRNYVHDVSSKWYDIGIELEISVGTLDNIKAKHHDPSDYLREMLIVWLKSIIPERPSWKALLTALCAKTVGEQALALDIRDKKRIPFDFSSTIGTPAKGYISQCGTRAPLSSMCKCHCGKQANLLTVHKDNENKGRKFYSCPNQGQCDFFKWADEPSATPSSNKQSRQQSGSTLKLGKGGADRQSIEEKCHCGLKATLRKRKKGENKGRYFYGCPKYFDGNGCNFYKSAPPGVRCSYCKELGHNIRSCGKKKTFVKRINFDTN